MANLNVQNFIFVVLAALLSINADVGCAETSSKPNIIVMLCDDLGIGDVQCFNREHGKIKTPSIDQLASEGMKFTDAHSASSVCTPTRYGILTGRYSWRTRLQAGVANGFNECLIAEDRPTVASFLKSQGYRTGIIGKWHLDMRYHDPKTGQELTDGKSLKFTAPVGAKSPDGPIHRGFDYFFGIHHARSMKAIIEQDTVIEHDQPINFLPRTVKKSVEFVNDSSKTDEPFLLYVPFGSPHTPILPTAEWQGKSGLGKYADFVMQTDDAVGQILKAVEENGIADNTLVIFTSDNGCSRQAQIKKLADKGHKVSAEFRGSKSDIWDGGHRVPFVAKWPGKIAPKTTSDQLICLNDIFATIADALETAVPEGSCEDSFSFLPAFSGKEIKNERKGIIHHSIHGHFAYRSENWKLILARGSGGWTGPTERNVPASAPDAQLYDMTADIGEQSNRYLDQQDVAKRLLSELEEAVRSGRTTPGPESKNDFDSIKLWKSAELNNKADKG